MLRLTKLTDYATVVLTEMARTPDAVHSAHELAGRVRMETPTVSKVLKQLAKAGLIVSYRGANGGYRLVRPPERINVAQMLEAMEGPLGMTECSIHEGLCAQEDVCHVRANWQRINQAVLSALRQVSLAEMAHPLTPPAVDMSALKTATGTPEIATSTAGDE